MRFKSSVFGKLVEPIDRRAFQAIVDRHATLSPTARSSDTSSWLAP